MKLYITPTSGNAWKVRLLLSMLKQNYETVVLDTAKGEHKTPEFLKLNPRGQVPVLVDGKHVFWDSTACLVYLARKYGGEQWLPTDAESLAEVQQWLALSNNELHYGLQWARGVKIGIRSIGSYDEYATYGRNGLTVLEGRLKSNDWLACGRPTIADLACYCYTAVSPEGGLPHDDFPGVAAWVKRIEALPGWIKRV
ncbi:MAG: glutathione S-transferase family protein [Betaproteobacteria bacterium]|nr:glutathione S-transferase family protein [Betaproteobacteria bacterium]MDH5343123.1 glutathione S-transferase family protein [Betaproteobacteria bacterium]